jgi:hypothetical protein
MKIYVNRSEVELEDHWTWTKPNGVSALWMIQPVTGEKPFFELRIMAGTTTIGFQYLSTDEKDQLTYIIQEAINKQHTQFTFQIDDQQVTINNVTPDELKALMTRLT